MVVWLHSLIEYIDSNEMVGSKCSISIISQCIYTAIKLFDSRLLLIRSSKINFISRSGRKVNYKEVPTFWTFFIISLSKNLVFSTFCYTENPKMQKNPSVLRSIGPSVHRSIGPSFSSSSQLSNFMFFFSTGPLCIL